MQHGVGIDAVVACVASAGGGHPAVVVALLTKEVIEVERYGECLVAEEGLGKLTVPDEFVGVHGGVVVASAAGLPQVGADLKPTRDADKYLASVAELPRIEVGIRLQLVAGVLIGHVAVDGHFQPVIAEAEVEALVQGCATCRVLAASAFACAT